MRMALLGVACYLAGIVTVYVAAILKEALADDVCAECRLPVWSATCQTAHAPPEH